MKKIIYAIFREWKFFIFIAVLLYGIYSINMNISKNINGLIRALPLCFDDVQIAMELSSINDGLKHIDSSFYDVKGELQSITVELSNISSQISTLELTRGRR